MTALVGILNRRAAVLAADSAVTVTNGDKRKIYNTATKIFPLSAHKPVGVMIYSSDNYMGVPWDVIINLYSERFGTKSFETLEGYANNFINFLSSEKCFNEQDSQMEYFSDELSTFYHQIKDSALNDYRKGLEDHDTEVNNQELLKSYLHDNFNITAEICERKGKNPNFEKYTINQLSAYGKEEFDKLIDASKEIGLPELRNEWESAFFNYIQSKERNHYSGVVFVGYGDAEIYPSLYPLFICGSFDNKLRYIIDDETADTITNENTASIRPFAQTDVMISLMKGINPKLYNAIINKFSESIDNICNKTWQVMKDNGASDELIAKVAEIDYSDISEKCNEEIIDHIQSEFVDGIIDAVDSFNIEDMINMGESLISITNLHRHISASEESVGGPVDVAVITRSQGFVWAKHKSWFNQK